MTKHHDIPSARAVIFDEVNNERVKQDKKWGEQNHKPLFWGAIVGEENGEVVKATVEITAAEENIQLDRHHKWLREYRMELVQLAAVTISALESFDRNEGKYLDSIDPM